MGRSAGPHRAEFQGPLPKTRFHYEMSGLKIALARIVRLKL